VPEKGDRHNWLRIDDLPSIHHFGRVEK